MYVPDHFSATDADALIHRLVKRAAAILITVDESGAPTATHAPMLWDSERKVARGHVARANPQWKGGDRRGLIVLSGPEGYISPSWYPSKHEHGKAVPTWNYEAVHLSGRVEWFDEPARLLDLVRALSDAHERGRAASWSVDDAPRGYIDAMLRSIVGVELHAERIEAKRKLSQNKREADFAGVVEALESAEDAMAREVAALMRSVSDDA